MNARTSDLAPSTPLPASPWHLAGLADFDPGDHDDTADDDGPQPDLWTDDFRLGSVIRDGNVIRVIRFKPLPVSTFKDATVIGDLDAPEVDALLDKPTVVGLTDRAPRVCGDSWMRFEGTWAAVIGECLSDHPESVNKGGKAMFFAESELTGKKRNGADLCHKLKDRIRRVHAVAIDVDGGCTVESVIARICARNLFAVIYTTHSHTSKGGVGSDRFRVILPLAEPFDMASGDDYQARYVSLCEALIPEGGQWDFTASRPSQLMYAPARPRAAPFKHYIVVGVGLDLAQYALADVSEYRKRGPSGIARSSGHDAGGDPAFLSDGFDLMSWWGDHGENFLLSSFLEMVGWDVLGSAGDGFDVTCPNASQHSEGTGNAAWAVDGPDSDNGALIYCHHSHCTDLRTWDFLKLVEGGAVLPDDCPSMSHLLCDPAFYTDDSDVTRADYVEETIKLEFLKTTKAVKRAFNRLSPTASEDAYAALYAGVAKGGNGGNAVETLKELMAGLARFDANARKRLEKRGRDLIDAESKASAAEKAEERREEHAKALTRSDLAHPSLDPAEPLGTTMERALATLANRFAPVDLSGKFRVVRKPDLDAFRSETDSTIVVYRKDDFLDLHLDRQLMVGDTLTNPARVFLETEKRKSGLVFAPPPMVAGINELNMYQGRKLKAKAGDWDTLKDFIHRIVCNGDDAKYGWLMLWMAHMVQRPGEKPGTAVILRGEGGAGKGTFGKVLAKLVAPHFKQLEKEGHVIGQFAGEHLSKCILAIVTEAVFGKNPKVSSEIKAMVDSLTMQVEAKGMDVITVLSFLRLFIDSNDELPILIEDNGSERRYFVMVISAAERQKLDFFTKVHAAIEGDEMAALLAYLETYDPADAGYTWTDVRTAPETEERKLMGWHSMRPAVRRLQNVLLDGEVTLTVEGTPETFTAGAAGLKVPKGAFRDFIATAGDKRNAGDSDIPAMFAHLFPDAELKEGQGRVGDSDNARWWLFPVGVLGDALQPPSGGGDALQPPSGGVGV